MKEFLDHLGRKIQMTSSERVVSLVPSITELLLDLGVNVVGRTKFCIHPTEKVENITVVGGTKKFRFESIYELEPTLIIANKEENYKEGIDQLSHIYPVWVSDIKNVDDSLQLVEDLGKLCAAKENAAVIKNKLLSKLDPIRKSRDGRVLYFIWYNPWMVAGNDSYIHNFLEFMGYENIVKVPRYPTLDTLDFNNGPDKIFLSSEPFPFKEKHIAEINRIFPSAKVELVNGEYFSWYGSRLLKF